MFVSQKSPTVIPLGELAPSINHLILYPLQSVDKRPRHIVVHNAEGAMLVERLFSRWALVRRVHPDTGKEFVGPQQVI